MLKRLALYQCTLAQCSFVVRYGDLCQARVHVSYGLASLMFSRFSHQFFYEIFAIFHFDWTLAARVVVLITCVLNLGMGYFGFAVREKVCV